MGHRCSQNFYFCWKWREGFFRLGKNLKKISVPKTLWREGTLWIPASSANIRNFFSFIARFEHMYPCILDRGKLLFYRNLAKKIARQRIPCGVVMTPSLSPIALLQIGWLQVVVWVNGIQETQERAFQERVAHFSSHMDLFRSRKKFSTTYSIVSFFVFLPTFSWQFQVSQKLSHTIFIKFCTVILHPKGPLRAQRHQNCMTGMWET